MLEAKDFVFLSFAYLEGGVAHAGLTLQPD